MKGELRDLVSAIAAVIALSSLGFTILVARRTWRYSDRTVRYAARNHHMGTVIEIERQLIARPELAGIWDTHMMASTRSMQPDEITRRQAFINLHVNLFESVYLDFLLPGTGITSEEWRSWEAWISAFFSSSNEARELFKKTASAGFYAGSFLDYVTKVIERAEVFVPDGRAS